jgi:hypothetical protein
LYVAFKRRSAGNPHATCDVAGAGTSPRGLPRQRSTLPGIQETGLPRELPRKVQRAAF